MTILKKNLQNMKKTWEALNNLLNRKTKKSRHVNAIKDFNNGNKINRNPQRIANIPVSYTHLTLPTKRIV